MPLGADATTATAGNILVADGTDFESVAVSGDATLAKTGALTVTDVTVGSDAAGDIQYKTSATALARLAKGTGGQMLAMNTGATAPEWNTVSGDATLAAGGALTVTDLTIGSDAAGDIFYKTSATVTARLAKGTALQQLRMNAGATAPEWAAAAWLASVA